MHKSRRESAGVTYDLFVELFAVVVIAAVQSLGGQTSKVMQSISEKVNSVAPAYDCVAVTMVGSVGGRQADHTLAIDPGSLNERRTYTFLTGGKKGEAELLCDSNGWMAANVTSGGRAGACVVK